MVKKPAKPDRRNRLIPAAVLLLIVLQGFFIYFYLIVPQGPFCWDEAHRSVYSLAMEKNLAGGNISALWQLTNRQIYWPFLHSWASAVFLLIGGYTYAAARSMSLVMNAAAVFTLFLVARKAAGREREGVGLIAVGLFVLSPIIVFFAATAMAESLGIFLTLLTLLAYLSARERSGPGWYLLTGFLLALLSFTKYIYAIFFGFGLFLFWASLLVTAEDRRRSRKELLRSWLVAAAFLACWLLWLAGGLAGEKVGIIIYRFGDTGGWDFLKLDTLDRFLYYPRALLAVYPFSPWIFPVYLGGLAWGLVRWRNLEYRLLLLLFLANLFPMAASTNLQERFIVTAAPALFLLSAGFLFWAWRKFPRRARIPVFAFWLLLLAGDLPRWPEYVRAVGNTTLGVLNLPARKTRPDRAFFGLFRYPGFFNQPKNLLSPEKGDRKAAGSLEDVYRFVWENTPPDSPLSALFQLNSASPHLWQWHSLARGRPITANLDARCHYFAVLKIDPDSIYRTMTNEGLIADRVDPARKIIEGLSARGLVEPWRTREFPELGLTVIIYRRTSSHLEPGWRDYLPAIPRPAE
ncbi:MAG: glycosyltransferase family 39 protein [Candidatus Erginobacter occultus]|nr:glycosyltransferase family 39 protein [Candidatus Erginobacter occultus]